MAAAGVEVDLILYERASRAMAKCTGKRSAKQWEGVLGLGNDGHRSRPVVVLQAADDDRAPRRRTDSQSTASLDNMAKSHETRVETLATLLSTRAAREICPCFPQEEPHDAVVEQRSPLGLQQHPAFLHLARARVRWRNLPRP